MVFGFCPLCMTIVAPSVYLVWCRGQATERNPISSRSHAVCDIEVLAPGGRDPGAPMAPVRGVPPVSDGSTVAILTECGGAVLFL